MNTPSPSRWGELFQVAVSIIDQANRDFDVVGHWTFGGGTALMLQIDHRESHDVDLFIADPQALPLLNPETQGFDVALAPSGYDSDGTRTLKITFDGVGEIDIICCGWLLENPAGPKRVGGREVWLETPAEIIAKKVHYRGANLQPRDMFDIAAVGRVLGTDYVIEALSAYRDEVRTALNVAEKFSPDLVLPILAQLNAKPEFEELRETAQEETVQVLHAAMAG